MAKDTARGGIQYKVLLKPTDIGLFVISRLQRPHVDKSAELRRFIELGYAAEQAGFILDGTVLRHAGRMWDTQPNFGEHTALSSLPGTMHHMAVKDERVSAPAAEPVRRPVESSTTLEERELHGSPRDAHADSTSESPLKRNLRGLSK